MSKPVLRETLVGKVRSLENQANSQPMEERSIACFLSRSTNTTVGFGTSAITWNDEELDTDFMFDVASPSRITIRTSGLYTVQAGLYLSGAVTADARIFLNGVTTPPVAVGSPSDLSVHSEVQVHWMGSLIPGDYLQIGQWNSGSLTLSVTAIPATFFRVAKIGGYAGES